jgi:hypothetical protein
VAKKSVFNPIGGKSTSMPNTERLPDQELDLEFEVWNIAKLILDHGINPDDCYAVEQFLRQQNSKASQRFIDLCQQAARRERDQARADRLFELLFERVEVDTGKNSDDFKQSIAEDVADELKRLAAANNIEWHSREATETNAAYLAALLLIECVVWRLLDDDFCDRTEHDYED